MENPPSGTVTFLFTDIEASTGRWQDEPEAMRARLAEHAEVLREVIGKRRGQLFKHTGDGCLTCSPQRRMRSRRRSMPNSGWLVEVLPVRMALPTGEAELRDRDYFGSTLNRCARLMGIAHGGQIV